MLKRIISLLLVLVTLASFVPFGTFAETADKEACCDEELGHIHDTEIAQYQTSYGEITENEWEYVYISSGGYAEFTFTPTYSDRFSFTSNCSYDTKGYILDNNGNQLAYDDDGGTNNNFLVSYNMTAGTTYRLRAMFYSTSKYGYVDVKVYSNHVHSYADATCTLPATCSCGATYGEALGHDYDNDCDTICNRCEEVRTVPHSYTDDCDATCNWCGEERTAPHAWTNACDPECNACGVTRTPPHDFFTLTCDAPQLCGICGETGPIPGHVYDYDCDAFCNFCNEEREVTHTYSPIFCDADCDVCGATRTPPHVWTNACDTECNYCKATRKITHKFVGATCTTKGKCAVCGAEGTALGHTYTNECDASCDRCQAVRTAPHKYKAIVVKATLTAHGYTAKQCTLCKKVINKVGLYKASDITISKASFTYNGKVQRPTVTVKGSNGVAIPSSNYTITYSSGSKNAGTYKVAITFKGNYSGSKVFTYKINQLPLSKVTIKLNKTSFTYNGKAQAPTIALKDAYGNTLQNKTDYTLTYSAGRKNVGTYKVTVTLKGNYAGSKAFTYTIKQLSASKVTVKLNKTEFAYNGKVQTPSLVLKDAYGNTLKNKTDYTITYPSGRKNVGTYKIVITFKGNYSSKKTVTYTIAPTLKTELSGMIGDTIKIGAKSNTKITYSSSNKKIATVNSKGVITAVGKGKTTISVKSGGVTRKIAITVTAPSIKITAPRTSLYIGETMKFTATTNPAGAKVTWKVNNKKLASISSKGVLTALGRGTVTVSGTITYKGKTYKSSYKVSMDVEYPDISVFISSKFEYSDNFGFTITNNSSRSLKVLDQGYVYCNGKSEDIYSLFAQSNGSYGYFKSLGVSPGSSRTMLLCLENKMQFYTIYPTYVYAYIEYGGELFKLTCSTNRSGLNKCSVITWMIKS